MSNTNSAVWSEGTEIQLDTEVEAGATGWTLNYVAVRRVGDLVTAHVEATNGAAAASLVTTLQNDFRPAATVTDPSGNFTIGTDGTVHFGGSTASIALHVLDVSFAAALASP